MLVIVHECKNLPSVHSTNLPDPYVKLEIIPNEKKIKKNNSFADPNYGPEAFLRGVTILVIICHIKQNI